MQREKMAKRAACQHWEDGAYDSPGTSSAGGGGGETFSVCGGTLKPADR